ncbi:gamma-butyrobetaine dioxygenase-like [Diadema antillarum]|uniref:gamma-butyrobetaine dioxygenase-like n=1 Tax=Diadema antillarum TaxID=105358 RepID=UPI003A8989D0
MPMATRLKPKRNRHDACPGNPAEEEQPTDHGQNPAGQPTITSPDNGVTDNDNELDCILVEKIRRALLSPTVMAALVKAVKEAVIEDVTQRVYESLRLDIESKEFVSECKYLGVILDSHLSWTAQISDKMDEASNKIISVARDSARFWFEVTWSDGYVGNFPYVWLRDNCPCESCFYPSTNQRNVCLQDLDTDIGPDGEAVDADGQFFEIVWTDSHKSRFNADWLRRHRFDKTISDPIKTVRVSWGAEFVDEIPTFDFCDVIDSDKTLYDWLKSLVTYGLCIVRGSPCQPNTLKRLCERVAYQRMTIYGWVQLLHFIRPCPGGGGESLFVDAKRIAEELKRDNPEDYDILTKVKVDFRSTGKDYVGRSTTTGEFLSVSYSNSRRAPYINIPVEEVQRFYRGIEGI